MIAATPLSASESNVGKASPEVVANQSSVQHTEAKPNTDRTVDQSLVDKSIENKKAQHAAILATQSQKSEQPAPALPRQPAPKERPASREPDVVFSSKEPASIANMVETKTKRETQPTHAAITEVASLPADSFQADKHRQEKPGMQARVDHFFANYIKAYEQRNLILFSRFFEADAEENGEPFTAILPTYLDLFAATKHISLQVEQRNWHLVDGKVAVNGHFKVNLEYADGRIINGSGPIDFVLADNSGELMVKKMELF